MFYKFFKGAKFGQVQKGIEELKEFGWPLNQLALNWVRQQPGIMTVLAGCRMPSQVSSNMSATDWELSQLEIEAIRKIEF